MSIRARDFDLSGLFGALQSERDSRGLSWAQVAAEINDLFAGSSARPISPSTLLGLKHRTIAEADGVLQMLRWLQRAPESFATRPADSVVATPLPHVDRDQI